MTLSNRYRVGTCAGKSNGWSCAAQPKCPTNQFLIGRSVAHTVTWLLRPMLCMVLNILYWPSNPYARSPVTLLPLTWVARPIVSMVLHILTQCIPHWQRPDHERHVRRLHQHGMRHRVPPHGVVQRHHERVRVFAHRQRQLQVRCPFFLAPRCRGLI